MGVDTVHETAGEYKVKETDQGPIHLEELRGGGYAI